jgi:acetyl esterase/lipase
VDIEHTGTVPRAFLIVSVVGALFTLNALWTPRRPELLAVPGFFAAWLTAELPFHQLAWQALATVVWVALGALAKPEGWAGLAITLASWAGFVVLIRRSAATPAQMEAALQRGLGPDYRDHLNPGVALDPPVPWKKIAAPFPMRDPAVTVIRDIAYVEDGHRSHRLDVYRPADGRTGCPTLFYIHGGAWVIGDKREQAIPMMLHLAARGWVCVTVNHRLAPVVRWPDFLLDVKQALAWVRRHGPGYGADPEFVVVSGGSAGGQLAALMALTANNPVYQPGFEDVDTAVQGAVLFYGVYDLTNRAGVRTKSTVRFFERTVIKAKLRDSAAVFAAASPMDQIRPDAPPTLIIQGSNDTLVPAAEARHFADLLGAVSTQPVVYAELRGAQHGFDLFPTVRTVHTVNAVARFCDFVYLANRAQRGASS